MASKQKQSSLFLAATLCAAGTLFAQMPEMQMGPAQTKPSTPVPAAQPGVHANVTFTKDVAPILQQHCQACHRPGEGTPFSMLTYESARPWAMDMKRMVVSRAMPPWFDDGTTKKFENKNALTQGQIDTLVAWVNAGAPKGDPKDMPAPLHWEEGWAIAKPDIIYQLPKPYPVPARGILEYQYVIIPTGFTKDTWVQAVEAAPTDRSVVHHIVAYVRAPGSNYFKDMPKNTFFEAPPAKRDASAPKDDVPSDWLIGYAPGQPPDIFKPGEAKLIPAGSDLVLEVHYMAEGKATTEQARIGLVLAQHPPTQRVMTLTAGTEKIAIPPNNPDYPIDASLTLHEDVTLLGMHPHMHMRGKAAQYRLVFPDGRKDVVLNVPHYNWRWQLWYNLAQPIRLPKGTRIECTEHFDNSKNNPDNPDPNRTVPWGQQSYDEMMVCMVNVAFPAKLTAKQVLKGDGMVNEKQTAQLSAKPTTVSAK